jgi:hypothetical protein
MDQFSLLILIALALGVFWKIRKDQELPILAEIQQALRKERELLHAKGNDIRALEFDRMIDAIQTGIAVAAIIYLTYRIDWRIRASTRGNRYVHYRRNLPRRKQGSRAFRGSALA